MVLWWSKASRMAEVSSALAFLLCGRKADQPKEVVAFREERKGCLADMKDNGGWRRSVEIRSCLKWPYTVVKC